MFADSFSVVSVRAMRGTWSRGGSLRQHGLLVFLCCFSNHCLPYYFADGSGGEVLWWARLSVCLSARISPEPHARSLSTFLCMLPTAVARSSSGMLQNPKGKGQFWGFSSPLTMHCNAFAANEICREEVTGVHSAGEVW